MLPQDNIKKILINYNHRLQILQQKKAYSGQDTRSDILMEIEDIEKIIEQLQVELKQLEIETQIPEDTALPSWVDGIPPIQVHGIRGNGRQKRAFHIGEASN